jgi:hypothetical protein
MRDTWGANQNYSANATNVTMWPVTVASGSTVYPYVPLQPVASPEAESNVRAMRKLTPVEWLRQQVEDVCLRAAMA